jgi:GT2 family glycosyltransferase
MQSAGHQELPDFYWADRAFKEDDLGQYDKVSYLPSLSHCCVLYRSQCLRDVGLIDEDFNMYLEDVDMSLRAKDKGWVLVYNPLSKATHIFHGSADEESLNFYCERNRLLLVAKHYPLKLAGALAGRGYFSSIEGRRELLSIMQDIIKKLLKHHSLDLALSLLSQIFESLGRIINLEKHQLIQKLDELSILLLEKGDEIKKLNLDINCRDNQLESLKRDLALIRNSRCYRFIALPISRISKIIKGS